MPLYHVVASALCTKEKASICLWIEPECAEGYQHVPPLSDGRTCHGIIDTAKTNFDEAVCDSDQDELRSRYMPNTPNEVNRLKLGILTGEEVWANAQMEPTGDWFINDGSETMLTEYYQDLRRSIDSDGGNIDGAWVPPDTILDVNGTTNGCLGITKHGLFHTNIKSECDLEKEPVCEYK